MKVKTTMFNLAVAVCILVLVLCPISLAWTIRVANDGSADYTTIQAAIDASIDGDLVLVAPGTYMGDGNRDIDFNGKAITIRSEAGPNTCIVDCEGTEEDPHTGFILRSPDNGTAILDGLMVMNGYGMSVGGGIQMERGCVVRNCIVADNFAEYGGGGIYTTGGVIVNCAIMNNIAGTDGSRADGGGIRANKGKWGIVEPLIINCTIVGNKATDKGGGVACVYGGTAAIENCIVVKNRAGTANQIWAFDEGKAAVAMRLIARNCCIPSDSCVDVWQPSCSQSTTGWSALTAEDILYTADPGFADPSHNDFRLRPDSPCVDAGLIATSAELPDTDLTGNPRATDGDRDGVARPDIGACEVPAPDEPYLWASAVSLRFTPPAEGLDPEPQKLTIQNLGLKASHWAAVTDSNWLTLTPEESSSDQEPTQMMVRVNTAGLEAGNHTCNVIISDDSASNSPLTIPVTLSATFHHVPSEYATIQQAIDAAEPYDTIVVADSVYSGPGNERIACQGKPLTIRSENGPEDCVIHCLEQTRAFVFDRSDRYCIVDGFTIAGYGAIQCDGSSPLVIRNCHIVGGKDTGWNRFYLSDTTIEDCAFTDCQTGLSARWSSVRVLRCTFQGNGIALACGEGCSLQLYKCDIRDSQDTAIYIENCNELWMTHCSIRGSQGSTNSCEAIYCVSPMSVGIEHSLISGNRLRGLSVSSCPDVTMRDTIVSGNGTYGVGCSRSNLSIENCTFVGNEGVGLIYGGPYWCDSVAEVRNSIFWANGSNQIVDNTIALTITYSDVQAGWTRTGNMDVDPLFANPGYWDPNGTSADPNDDFWVDGDYHLESQAGRWDLNAGSWVKDDVTSPCIDAGDPNSPIGYEPFPNGGRINMGAYGGTIQASKSYFGQPACDTIVAGDINGDGRVDWLDLDILASHWLQDVGK